MANDNWRTPAGLFSWLNKQYNFYCDMACTPEDQLTALGSYDSLSKSWVDILGEGAKGEFVFCNPPYSKPLPWVKAAVQAQKDGIGTVMLLNADTSPKWFLEALQAANKISYFINGRIAFIDADGNPQKGNTKPQMLIHFFPSSGGKGLVTEYIKLVSAGEWGTFK